jgi:hypothetical protein
LEAFMAKINYLLLADFFREDLPWGGAELASDALIQLLRKDNPIVTKRCHETSPELIKNHEGVIVVSNRQNLSEPAKQELYKKDYILWEHDFHYLKSRDAGLYDDLKAPEDEVINREIYEAARRVVFQSKAQLHAANRNLGDNEKFVSANGNPWNQCDLDYLKELQAVEKTGYAAVLLHPYETKGTAEAVRFCKDNDFEYTVIPPMPQKDFLQMLAKFQILVFLPKIFETYSRVSFQARCLNLSLMSNQKVGFKYEDHSRLHGLELIEFAEQNNEEIKRIFT